MGHDEGTRMQECRFCINGNSSVNVGNIKKGSEESQFVTRPLTHTLTHPCTHSHLQVDSLLKKYDVHQPSVVVGSE